MQLFRLEVEKKYDPMNVDTWLENETWKVNRRISDDDSRRFNMWNVQKKKSLNNFTYLNNAFTRMHKTRMHENPDQSRDGSIETLEVQIKNETWNIYK